MKSLTRDEITATLGELDDMTVVEILSSGANADELAEARAWLANDEPLMNMGKPLAAGRVGILVDILTRLEAEEPGPEEPGPLGHPV
jgi:hypothetical protein